MKKLFFLLMLTGIVSIASAQVANYSFSQANNTYTPIVGGRVIGTTATAAGTYFTDSTVSAGSTTVFRGIGLPIGFNFTYNGSVFNEFGVNSDGWISLGQDSVNMNSSAVNQPISATSTAPAALQNRVSALGRSLIAQAVSELRYETIGSAPNRTLVVQWSKYKRTTGGAVDTISFQIQLNETTNIVDVEYGKVKLSSGTTVQVGLRGTANTDYNNRLTTTNWATSTAGTANNSTMTLSNTVFPASGLTFIWAPPAAYDAGVTAINSPAAIIPEGVQKVTVTIKDFGLDTLTTVTIGWSVNGTVQPPFSWIGSLAHGLTNGPDSIGTFNFTMVGNNLIKAWTTNPDGNTDGNFTNDTATLIVNVLPANDIAAYAWVSPVSGCGLTSTEAVTVKFRNPGTQYQINIPLLYSIDGGLTYIAPELYTDTVHPGDTITYTFLTTADFSTTGTYNCVFVTNIPGDESPLNDTIRASITTLGEIAGNPFIDSLEHGNNYYALMYNTNSLVALSSGVGDLGTHGFDMTGGAQGTWPAGSSATTTAALAFSYTDHISTVTTCMVDASAYTTSNLYLKFDLKQTHSTGIKYSFLTVLANGIDTISDITGAKYFNPITATSDPFASKVFNLSSYAGTTFTLEFMAACKYNDATYGSTADHVFIDDITLSTKPVVNLGNDTSFCQGGSVTLDAGASPTGYTYLYNWYTLHHPATIATTQTITVDTGATYIVSVNNGFGVITNDTVVIGVNPIPVVSLGHDTTNCGSYTLDAGAGYSTYTWSTGANTQTLNVTSTGTYWVDVTNTFGCAARDSVHVTIIPLPTVSAGPNQIMCYLDTLNLLTSSAANYDSLLWTTTGDGHFINDSTLLHSLYKPGANDISSGSVNLIITAFSLCGIISDTLTLTVTSTATANAGPDQEICFPGSALLAATGGTVYSWSPATGLDYTNIPNPVASPSVTTTYTVTVTSSCGSATASVMVTVDHIIVPYLGNDTILCAGLNIPLDAGAGYDSYLWSTGATTQTITVDTSTTHGAGTFKVYVDVTNGVCMASDTINISFIVPTASAGTNQEICYPGSANLLASGGTSYSWSPATGLNFTNIANPIASPSVTTTYNVIVTSSCGSASANVMVTVDSIIIPNLGNDTTLCPTENITLNAGTGYVSYLWSTGATTPSITVDSSTAHTGLGTLKVYVDVTNGVCVSSDTIKVTFAACLGITEYNSVPSISIYPNPTTGMTNIVVNGLNRNADLSIYTLQGQSVYNDKITGNSVNRFDLSYLPKGVYLVRISNEKTNLLNKLVIQ